MTSAQRRWLPVATVALLALLATITSIGHDFTYDDRGVIFENDRLHSMLHLPRLWLETYWPVKYGGDGYRPIVTTLFTLQWTAANGAPWLFHLGNIVLAVATALAVHWCAAAVLSPFGALVAAALFAVHPVHVEVTGNVVGQSELIVALCLSLAMGLYLRRRTSGMLAGRDVASVTALFAIALFAKEHAIVLPALIVAAELTVIRGEPWRVKVRATRLLFLAMIAVELGYLYVRGLVQSELAGFLPYPIFRFLHMRAIDRIGTMMNEIPRIAQLLLFPTTLSADYSPTDVTIANGLSFTELPGYFICVATLLLAFVFRRRTPVASFGLLWLVVAFLPVSNLLIPAGFITAERTLFFPSIGVVLIAGAVAEHVRATASESRRRLGAALLGCLILAGLARSIDRQRVWKNNDAFFVALMHDAPNGYRAHFLYARHVGLKSRLSQMEHEYRVAMHIFPYDAGMTLAVADAYSRAGMCAPAVPLFQWTFSVEPTMGEGRYEYVYCLARLGRWADVRREAIIGMQYIPARDIRLMHIGIREANISLGRSQR
jgi:hypothetical protein